MQDYGLQQSSADPCLFIKITHGQKIVVLYVDDELVASHRNEDLKAFPNALETHFQVKVLAASCFLGLQTIQHNDATVTASQENYIKKMLEKFHMSDGNSVSTPMCGNLRSLDNSVDVVEVPYREAIGSLMY
jgi:hypothetical protein